MTVRAQKTLLDRYEVLETLGEGGFGTVYAARDRTTGRAVALKALTRGSPLALSRFKQEFRAVQEVHHPNLVRLEALLEDGGQFLIAMELIEGTDLFAYVRPGGPDGGFDDERLREAFRQLAEGLMALHRAGYVHRDLKPSNVRVTAEGRTVLLDFGLTTPFEPGAHVTEASGFGTMAYMAPEQANGDALGPAADWYAFGVCLYEALTGVLPISAATNLELALAKQHTRPPPPSVYVSTLARDLELLCMGLLDPDPAARADGEAVLSVLARETSGLSVGNRSLVPPASAGFAGREQELELLEAALREVRGGAQRLVLLEGESGIGKSGLTAEFVRSVHARHAGALVLRSRCYENEQLPYKAFDGAMDDLARALGRLDQRTCDALLPPRAGLLCRVFPVLSSVQAMARASLRGAPLDPNLQRSEAFLALTRLFDKLSETRLVVIAIDDLQWADAESFRLLRALVEDAHPPAVLVLATVRPREELDRDVLAALDALAQSPVAATIPLRGLPLQHTRTLARQLLASDVADPLVDTIASESRGHPLFLTVLARFAEGGRSAGELTLGAALSASIAALTPQQRDLLDATAVADVPQPLELLGRVAELSPSELDNVVAELCAHKLLRLRRGAELTCFHDLIRRTALAALDPERRRGLHGRLARELWALGHTDPVLLARHYDAAGEHTRALHAYRRAAERAMDALAFARSAGLYERALELGDALGIEREPMLELKVERGHALARSGRSVDAAHQYLDAVADANPEQTARLKLWAAQHLLQGAELVQGLAVARDVLGQLGLVLPKTQGAALRRWLWHVLVSKIRGRPRQAEPVELEVEARMRLETAWGLALPLAWLDPLRGSWLTVQHGRMAFATGDPKHIAGALALEAQRQAITYPEDGEAVRQLFVRARALTSSLNDDTLQVFLASREGAAAAFRMDLRHARDVLEEAERMSIERCRDEPWLLTNTRIALGTTWANMGEHVRLAASTRVWAAEADERDDRFARAAHEGLGYGFFRFIMADDPDAARATLCEVMAPWPEEPFCFVHFGELLAIYQTELYRGGSAAHAWLSSQGERHARAILVRAGFGKPIQLMFRALSCLAACRELRADRRSQLLAQAHGDLRSLRKVRAPFASSSVPMLEAQLAALAGRTEDALVKVQLTRSRATDQERWFLYQQATYFQGTLEGGDTGRDKRDGALAFFAEQGWKDPRRAVGILCPTVDLLEAGC